MPRKPSLPLLGVAERAPTLEAARRRLGGSCAPSTLDGRSVRVGDASGVVIAASERDVHVLVTADVVRRVSRAELEIDDGAPVDARLSADVRIFAQLRNDDRVRFVTGEGEPPGEGVLFERCRFGALVARDDGTIVAVGYRRLWPANAASA